uniref:Uncharacterized protein AlNc14C57G4299 n=1 Tax=Albugo laibachii Nc14 TaxID=890382 RepID=F0WCB5_9STRA|nr:conserved hypothetical protein [Albugo laibachii Nc14]|eukprot:CCA18830.1 conserved hypothetical protein [Albugo laibachii Nc14]
MREQSHPLKLSFPIPDNCEIRYARTMIKQRTLVSWSPHEPSVFAVGDDNIRICETETALTASTSVSDSHIAFIPERDVISDEFVMKSSPANSSPVKTTQRNRSFRLLKLNAQVNHVKCLEWYPVALKPMLIAAGLSAGKIVLNDFQGPQVQTLCEFSPKYARPCNSIAWNPLVPHQIVGGFDKVRGDFCTLVWDLHRNGDLMANFDTSASMEPNRLSFLRLDSNKSNSSTLVPGLRANGDLGGANASSNLAGTSTNSIGLSVNNFPSIKKLSTFGIESSNRSGDAIDFNKPSYELANSEATVAVSWVPMEPSLLVTGTGFKWLRLYDLRMQTHMAPLSVVAHTKAVFGVTFDPQRPHLLATYSDGMQECIKVWDIRRIDASTSPLASIQPSSRNISHIVWCPARACTLVSSSSDEKYISFWDINGSPVADPLVPNSEKAINDTIQVLKKPFKRRYTSKPVASFSWQKSQRTTSEASSTDLSIAAFPDRILVASVSGEIDYIAVQDSMPLTLSPLNTLAFSSGQVLFGDSLLEADFHKPNSTMASQDVSEEMYRMAKQGYSTAIGKNLELLKAHFNSAKSRFASRQYFRSSRERYQELGNVWRWIQQIEMLRNDQVARLSEPEDSAQAQATRRMQWPINPNILEQVGVRNLLNVKAETFVLGTATFMSSEFTLPGSTLLVDPVLGCSYYEALGRKLALLACHWEPEMSFASAKDSNESGLTGNWALPSILTTHESGDTLSDQAHSFRSSTKFESEAESSRAAAIAAFHGDLQSSISFLQKAALSSSQQAPESEERHAYPVYSSDIYQLVAMAVAGYSSDSTLSKKPNTQASLWMNMCQQLLKRNEISSSVRPRYLHALLTFLCACSVNLSSRNQNRGSMSSSGQRQGSSLSQRRRSWGSTEGFLNANLKGDGNESSITSFVSILNDTTLFLSDRMAFACRFLPAEELGAFIKYIETEYTRKGFLEGLIVTGLDSKGLELMQTYLDRTSDIQTVALIAARLPAKYNFSRVLSQWIAQYQDLLNHLRLFHERARFDVGRSQLQAYMNGVSSLLHDSSAQMTLDPSSATLPPHLYVRCNYCNASLSLASLLRLGGSHSSWLNRAKPKLSCCPSCRKPLPRCTLCLLPFGCLNPYFELARRRSKQLAENVNCVVTHSLASSGMPQEPSAGSATQGASNIVGQSVIPESDLASKSGENMAQLSSIPFVEWFTWCQTCKHGGHSHHLADWFENHAICPVTDCKCQCRELDQPLLSSSTDDLKSEPDHNSVSGTPNPAKPYTARGEKQKSVAGIVQTLSPESADTTSSRFYNGELPRYPQSHNPPRKSTQDERTSATFSTFQPKTGGPQQTTMNAIPGMRMSMKRTASHYVPSESQTNFQDAVLNSSQSTHRLSALSLNEVTSREGRSG